MSGLKQRHRLVKITVQSNVMHVIQMAVLFVVDKSSLPCSNHRYCLISLTITDGQEICLKESNGATKVDILYFEKQKKCTGSEIKIYKRIPFHFETIRRKIMSGGFSSSMIKSLHIFQLEFPR